MTYKPQLSKPKGPNPYYIKKPDGFSPCILGNNSRGQRDPILNVLPNCVGYATGAWWERQGIGIPYGFATMVNGRKNGDACNFIKSAQEHGLKITNEPTLGGIMVWSGGKSGQGHVAICEVKYKDGTVTSSDSEYNGSAFTTYRRGGKNYTDGCAWMRTGYAYIGCINNPAVEEEEEMTQEKFNEMMNVWLEQQKTKKADAYAAEALAWAKEKGIMVGDGTGNQMPQSFVKREDLAVMLKATECRCGK